MQTSTTGGGNASLSGSLLLAQAALVCALQNGINLSYLEMKGKAPPDTKKRPRKQGVEGATSATAGRKGPGVKHLLDSFGDDDHSDGDAPMDAGQLSLNVMSTSSVSISSWPGQNMKGAQFSAFYDPSKDIHVSRPRLRKKLAKMQEEVVENATETTSKAPDSVPNKVSSEVPVVSGATVTTPLILELISQEKVALHAARPPAENVLDEQNANLPLEVSNEPVAPKSLRLSKPNKCKFPGGCSKPLAVTSTSFCAEHVGSVLGCIQPDCRRAAETASQLCRLHAMPVKQVCLCFFSGVAQGLTSRSFEME